jgi:PAS domain S-box-containing protein
MASALRLHAAVRPALLGCGVALAIVLLQEFLADVFVRVPNPAVLFFVAVVYATYVAGWIAGSMAALVGLAYASGVLLSVAEAASAANSAALRVMVLLPSFAAVVGLVHVLKRRADAALAAERDLARQREALREAEHARRLADTLAVLDDVVWSTTIDGSRVLSVSAAAERLYGYPLHRFLEEPHLWQQLILPEDRAAVFAALEQIEAKGMVDLEYRILRSDGSVRRVRDRAHLSRDAAGRPLRFEGVVTDITAEREAQAALRRLTNLYAALSECNQAIVRLDTPDALYREVCRIAVDFGGLRMAWIGSVRDGRLEPLASAGARQDYLDSVAGDIDGGQPDAREPSLAAICEGAHAICHGIEYEPGSALWRERALACGFHAAAAFPVRQAGQVVGCLSFYAPVSGFFDQQLADLLDEMAADVSFALDRFQLEAERAEVAAQLRVAEERWQFALDGADTGVWDWDLATNKVYYSPRWKGMIGYADAEIGDSYTEWESRVHPDDLARCVANIRSHLAGETPVIHNEHRLRGKDGSYRWILGRGRVMSRMADGRPQRLMGTHTDITPLKEHEAALAESGERLHALFHNMEEGVALHEMVCDGDGRPVNYVVVAVNPSYVALTGLKAEAVVGRTADIAYGTAAPPYLEVFAEVALSGKPARLETRFAPLDRDFSISIAPWGPGGFATIFTDVSARKRAEAEVLRLNAELERRVGERTAQLAASNRDLESFSYTVSHDLRAPLRAINGFASLLDESEAERLSPEGRRLLDRIVSNTRRMSQLIDDILEYSRVGRAHLRLAPTDLTRLVHEVAGELHLAYPATEVVVRPLPRVNVDGTMMRQVFANLIGNALKFSARAADPRVEIGAHDGASGLEFYVRDNGAGFDMRYADKLFGMFQRMHGAAEFPGTGVGLAIVKRLVERHGGRIRAEAQPGAGATFFFTLGG